ncbi:MAG: Mov34/MPN/PAD-1 family protein [Myxococcota bacterium]
MEGPRRIEVSSELEPAVIDGRLLNEMCAHARETCPEECCGLVTGPEPGRYDAVHRCGNEMTRLHLADPTAHPRDGTRAFHMNELDYLKVSETAAREGQQVTAVYHSHVGAGAYFSELDQEFASQALFPFPDADHLVLAVYDRRVMELGLFRRNPIGGFSGRPVVADPS